MALFAGEICGEERTDQVASGFRTDDARAEDEDVHIVVLDPLPGRVVIVADGGADAGDFVRRDTRADPRAADQNAPLGATFQQFDDDGPGKIGVVVGREGIRRAEVGDGMTRFREPRKQLGFESEPGMVGGNGDSHGRFLGVSRTHFHNFDKSSVVALALVALVLPSPSFR